MARPKPRPQPTPGTLLMDAFRNAMVKWANTGPGFAIDPMRPNFAQDVNRTEEALRAYVAKLEGQLDRIGRIVVPRSQRRRG